MPKKKKKKEPKTEALVYNRGGFFVRKYCLKVHGEKFQEMAEQYAKDLGEGYVK